MRTVLVTGGNQGIGRALCHQLAIDRGCHVYLAARNLERGEAAASEIRAAGGSVDFLPMDVSCETSIRKAAGLAKDLLKGGSFYGIVNNAGVHGKTDSANCDDTVFRTNLYGPKRVCDHFLPLLDPDEGRIVNVGSGGGPSYVSTVRDNKAAKVLCSPESEKATWEWIEEYARTHGGKDSYRVSKALLAVYTGLLARENPDVACACVTPGFIETRMTKGWGASKTPEEGTTAMMKCLFDELPGNGWYYGSDGLRSPYHFMRGPGEPEYDGVHPFL